MKKVLGKGLGALIPGAADEEKVVTETSSISVIREIPVSKIKPSPFQPRMKFDEAGIEELAQSIEARGVIQPIVVRSVDNSYELMVGERRLRAVRSLGRETIPAVVHDGVSNEEAMELTLIENIQREDLNAIEEAQAYYRLMTECGLTQDAAASRVGKSRSAVANSIRLLSLPKPVQEMVIIGRLTAGHARVLLAVKSDPERILWADRIDRQGLSVRDLERIIYAEPGAGRQKRVSEKRGRPAEIVSLEEQLKRKLSTKVTIKTGRKGGKIIIDYYSNSDLERLLELMGYKVVRA